MNKLIHNITTGEIIVRDLTADELAEFEAEQIRLEAENKKIKERQKAKAALLERLGITEEEAKLLLS
jgi:hypothetical protein